MDVSSSFVSFCDWASVPLQVLAISLDVLHHVVLTSEFIVGREVTDDPVERMESRDYHTADTRDDQSSMMYDSLIIG